MFVLAKRGKRFLIYCIRGQTIEHGAPQVASVDQLFDIAACSKQIKIVAAHLLCNLGEQNSVVLGFAAEMRQQ